jgi:2-oxoacid:acceptor oxidoreductase delta subunit (pyruvate/2-ketoisovalerate family)
MEQSCQIPEEIVERPAAPSSYGHDEAVRAARLCFATVLCSYCDVCRLLCPDLCITRDAATGRIVIDLDYCKGCGLCAHYCPKGAIRMTLEVGRDR